jgi:peroxiredoxin
MRIILKLKVIKRREMIRRGIMIMLFLICNLELWAQDINISLKHFPSEHYMLIGYKGTKNDTIAKGSLDKQGNAKVQLPAFVKEYQGMASLVIGEDSKMDLILNNESFSIASDFAYPDTRTTQFTGSEENKFFKDYLLGEEVTDNPKLYASQLKKEIDYLKRILVFERASGEEIEKLRSEFLNQDMLVLYHSSYWKTMLSYWVAMYNNRIKDDDKLIIDALYVFDNIKQEKVLDEFTNNLIDICEQYGWEYIKNQLVQHSYNLGRLKSPTRNLAILLKSRGVQIGETPPDFLLDKKTKLSSLFKDKVLLFFYDSNCDLCKNEIEALQNQSEKLIEKKIKIVSVSVDPSKEELEENTKKFLWKYKLNDPNNHIFYPYGVIMTPTYFVIEKGKITGRYAQLLDTGLLQ